MAADPGSGTYLYAVAAEADPGREAALPQGVVGGEVRAIGRAGLVAYVSTVPLDQFGEEPLRRSMEDLDWLEETARAHHGVVEAVAREAAVVPVRLVTVYSGDAQVWALLEERHDDFARALARVAGRQEWGVKVYAAPGEEAGERAAGEEPSGEGEGEGEGRGEGEGGKTPERPGTAYLKRRQQQIRGREEAWRRAGARAEDIHGALSSIAVASRRHRAQDPQLSGRPESMVLNGAYLVDRERGEEFARAVERLRGPGGDVQLTGPWAPYSFAVLDDDGGLREGV
ncbi:GvpL/GvpF family gas vesicle protein [Nonomuraea sp. SMC257]|uniref:GvpL/GvpF family gas vesicle protein n=1 Tax=Nonomuraea montanisoli TaxID=2741721 RepID=A0A7Y6I2M0_9ACTN|nr:GvpL/GvpF family gas vesicle protein [Nonomuraea montanisoli]NUW30568.1 GvpL/GvpF family gas vesicle protein [Nonomuraea montanisoli]